jgi:hypothetical protein
VPPAGYASVHIHLARTGNLRHHQLQPVQHQQQHIAHHFLIHQLAAAQTRQQPFQRMGKRHHEHHPAQAGIALDGVHQAEQIANQRGETGILPQLGEARLSIWGHSRTTHRGNPESLPGLPAQIAIALHHS